MKIVTLPEAIALKAKFYFTGQPCVRGHITERSVARRQCVECARELKAASKRRVHARKRYITKDGTEAVQPDKGIGQYVFDGMKLSGASTMAKTEEGLPIWIKMTKDDRRQQEIIEASYRALADGLEPLDPVPASGNYLDDLLVAYPIGDGHVGMSSWHVETGEDWDLRIAEEVHRKAMNEVVQRSPRSKHALIVNLGDMLHYDSLENKTPRSGHIVDADGRYNKMAWVATKVMMQAIESALQHHEQVHVVNVQGNHDETGAQWLTVALTLMYRNEPRVTVEPYGGLFTYYRWGKCLLGMHHGHTAKKDNLPAIMATDRAKDWGETLFRHWLTGHVHHESVKRYPGCTVETFNTLAAKDAYATNGGWRSERTIQSITYHKEGRLHSRQVVYADEVL